MEHINFDLLSDQLKFLGFNESLHADLKEMLEMDDDSFELVYRNVIERESVQAVLYFRRTDPEGFFFLSKYSLSLHGRQHTFYIFKGRGITVKEGFNLLNGRAVYKQRLGKNGQKYNEWIELDLNLTDDSGFKINLYPDSHGFDLAGLIDNMLIDTPSPNWDRSMLIRSLERGNLQSAFIKEAGSHRRVFLRANPRERTITVHEIELPFWEKAEESKMGDDIENALPAKSYGKSKLKNLSR